MCDECVHDTRCSCICVQEYSGTCLIRTPLGPKLLVRCPYFRGRIILYLYKVGTQSSVHISEAVSAVRLVRPWPDHFSVGRWSRSQTASAPTCYTCVYDVQLLVIWRIPLLAVVLLLSLALHVGLMWRLPTASVFQAFIKRGSTVSTVCEVLREGCM